MAYPDYDQFLSEVWGWGSDVCSLLPLLSLASNVLIGTNPAYTAIDFLNLYPKFGGTPVTVTGTLDGATGVLTAVSSFIGIATGQLIAGQGIPPGSVIIAFDPTAQTITINNPTTVAGNGISIKIYVAPLLPLPVLSAYLNLASSALQQVRWQEMWTIAMGLYIAHFCTLWMQSESGPNSTAAQAAVSGLAQGFKVSKVAGDVSVGIKPIEFNDWGTFALTTYGQQLVTFAKTIGSGGMLIV